MDRRFLSQTAVIAASRKFICVRMMTYESASEAQLLKSLWRPGAELENTLFAILDPYGQPLTRGARGPEMIFRDANDMAAGLNEIARYYQSRSNEQALPTVRTVRLAMNVAACDKRPLAIVMGDNEQERRALENKLAPVSWSADLVGKIIYGSGTKYDTAGLQGIHLTKGYVFVSPNEFGTEGTVVTQLNPTASAADLAHAIQQTMSYYHPMQMDHRDHIRWGREQGIHWTSEIPITDPHEIWAQQNPRF